ncbi:MAG: AAA family ATPase [Myxococcales bacterium]|nr:AAA family ATPase [Myxococcales bacterium]
MRAKWVVVPRGEGNASLHRTPRPKHELQEEIENATLDRGAPPPSGGPPPLPPGTNAPTHLPPDSLEPRPKKRDPQTAQIPNRGRDREPEERVSGRAQREPEERVSARARREPEERPSERARREDRERIAHKAEAGVLQTHMLSAAEAAEQVRKARPPRERTDGCEITVFFGCRGGVGCTTLATSVAAELATTGRRVALLDLDLQFGTVLTALDLQQSYPLSEIYQDRQQIRDDSHGHWRERLPRHASGAYVLSQVGHIDSVSEIDHEAMKSLVHLVQDHFDVLIVDGIRDFNDHAMALLDQSDQVVLVGSQDVPSMRGLSLRLDVFRRLGWGDADLHLVLNRYSRKANVSLSAIENALGVEPSFVVANDFNTAHRALDSGTPLSGISKRARITRDVIEMTEGLFHVSLKPTKKRRFGKERS